MSRCMHCCEDHHEKCNGFHVYHIDQICDCSCHKELSEPPKNIIRNRGLECSCCVSNEHEKCTGVWVFSPAIKCKCEVCAYNKKLPVQLSLF